MAITTILKKIPLKTVITALTEPELESSFSIRAIQKILDGKDMLQQLHRHDYFFILLLKKGKGKHSIDFEHYTIADHTIFCMRPGQVHELQLKSGSTGWLLQFKKDFYPFSDQPASQVLYKATHQNYYRLRPEVLSPLDRLLDAVLQEYTGKQQGYQQVIRANLDIVFIKLLRQQQHIPSSISNSYKQERLEDFLQLLEKHMVVHKHASQYAQLLHLSLYQLNVITKATSGKTSSAIINECIILECKRLLLATSAQVKEIAGQLGYEEVSYFIRFFKKHSGYSPDVFRQKFK